jgi:hypothetical protein
VTRFIISFSPRPSGKVWRSRKAALLFCFFCVSKIGERQTKMCDSANFRRTHLHRRYLLGSDTRPSRPKPRIAGSPESRRPSVLVPDRDRKKLEEYFADYWAGAGARKESKETFD